MDGSRQSQVVVASAAFTAGVATVLIVNVMIDFSHLARTFRGGIRRRMAETFHSFADKLNPPGHLEQEEQSVVSFECQSFEFEDLMELETDEKTKTETFEPMYQLPPWFLNNCVKTLEDLRASEIPLRVRDLAIPEEQQTESHYEMDEGAFSQLRTLIQQKPPSATAQSYFNHDATVFRTPVKYNQSAAGFHQAVLEKLGLEMGADIVMLRPMDLKLLCEQFALDKAQTLERDEAYNSFFGTPSNGVYESSRRRSTVDQADGEIQPDNERSRIWEISSITSDRTLHVFPFQLLFESPSLKESIANETSFSGTQKRRPLLMILSEVSQSSTSCEWGKVLVQLREAVGLVNSHFFRIMVVGLNSFYMTYRTLEDELLSDGSPFSDRYSSPRYSNTPILPLLGSKPLSVQPILHSRTRGQELLLEKHMEVETSRYNIDMLQNATRRRLGVEFACDLLEPYATWDTTQDGNALDALKHSELDPRTCEFVADRVHGDLSIENLAKVLGQRRAMLQWLNEHWNTIKSPSHELTEWSHLSKSAQGAIKKIKANSHKYEWESYLLDQMVNPRDVKFTWADIELEDDVKRAITQIVDLAHSEAHSQTGLLRNSRINGALLYGPPGTGKTHLARVLAKEYDAVMIHVSGAEIESKWVGETEKIIKALFNLASMVAPSIIFIDEADSMFSKRRSDDKDWVRSRVNTFLAQTDGLIKADRPPFLLLATNHPNELDEAVLRRVPGKLYMRLPTTAARNKMLAIFLREEIMEPEMRLSDIAAMTSGFTGSDIRNLCVQAALISQAELRETQQKDHQRILRFTHFQEAIRRCAPTVSGEAIDTIRDFARKFDHNAMGKVGNSYSEADVAKRQQSGKKAPRIYERGTTDQIPNWMKSGQVKTGESTDLSLDDWKKSDLYPYVTEELCQKWWQNSQEPRH